MIPCLLAITWATAWLRPLVASLTLRKTDFDPRPVSVETAASKLAERQISLRRFVLRNFLVRHTTRVPHSFTHITAALHYLRNELTKLKTMADVTDVSAEIPVSIITVVFDQWRSQLFEDWHKDGGREDLRNVINCLPISITSYYTEPESSNEQCINFLMPNVNYSGRTAPLTFKVAFYIFFKKYWYWIF